VDGAVKVGAPVVEGAKVVCEILEPLVKGEKVIVFKKKRRKGYRRKNGHRQYFSKVLIKEVVA
ncbi:MAG: 50S ribosomal protein L21, partial [Paramuribaculum sp.]|nr:50S ribosomal protein L21 [Paramuribaculum sp.]